MNVEEAGVRAAARTEVARSFADPVKHHLNQMMVHRTAARLGLGAHHTVMADYHMRQAKVGKADQRHAFKTAIHDQNVQMARKLRNFAGYKHVATAGVEETARSFVDPVKEHLNRAMVHRTAYRLGLGEHHHAAAQYHLAEARRFKVGQNHAFRSALHDAQAHHARILHNIADTYEGKQHASVEPLGENPVEVAGVVTAERVNALVAFRLNLTTTGTMITTPVVDANLPGAIELRMTYPLDVDSPQEIGTADVQSFAYDLGSLFNGYCNSCYLSFLPGPSLMIRAVIQPQYTNGAMNQTSPSPSTPDSGLNTLADNATARLEIARHSSGDPARSTLLRTVMRLMSGKQGDALAESLKARDESTFFNSWEQVTANLRKLFPDRHQDEADAMRDPTADVTTA